MKIIIPEYTNDSTLIASNVSESDNPLWDATTSYALGAVVNYIISNVHWTVKSLVVDNLGNTPTGLTTDTKWVYQFDTNRWKMFDQYTTSQTVNNDSIDVTLDTTGRTDSLALLNLDGASVTINGVDQYGANIYSTTKSLVSVEGITDYYTYFFSPIVKITDLVLTDLPLYAFARYSINISNIGSTAKCGAAILGLRTDLGVSSYGLRLGNNDYSIKSSDEWGNYTITKRNFSKSMSLNSVVDNSKINAIFNFLNNYRATPIVFMGANDYSSTFMYGFYKDFGITIQYVSQSNISFDIEGL